MRQLNSFPILKVCTLILILQVAWIPQSSSQVRPENQMAISYFRHLSTLFVGRPLLPQEIQRLGTEGQAAFADIVQQWSTEEAFYENIRLYFDLYLRTNGQNEGIDFNLPGYLAKAIAKNQRPYTEILTSTSCYDTNSNPIPCDTGAPYTAGVLTTRAFLASNRGVYNIARAGKLVSKFLCTDYPLPQTEEPPLQPEELIAEFATTNGAISFGNGNNCYSCHSQFGLHAQFFVKFDLAGNYFNGATGLQDPSTGDGISFNQTATSHYRAPQRAASERSRMLGRQANNLAEAAQMISRSRRFLPCGVENLMKHFLKLNDSQLRSVPKDLMVQIAREAKELKAEPGFAELLQAIVTNPHVYESFRKTGAQL